MNSNNQKLLGIDAGGTFTDFVLVEFQTNTSIRVHKTLSTPNAPEKAILQGISDMGLDESLGDGSLQIVHGSTVATNAVLEGNLARTVFITNYGFADMLRLARQTRPQLYALEAPAIPPPVPPELCLETGGRVAADGSVLAPLTQTELQELLEKIDSLQPEAIAINLLFSFLDDTFERRIEDAIKQENIEVIISRSSKILPEYKEYERGIATWLNAALGPVISRYLNELSQKLGTAQLQIMQSSGETMSASTASESAVHLLLSGPAGGLTAIEYLAQQVGRTKFISFDMGGTSTDVALLDGRINTSNESFISRYPIAVPMVDMETIGAGGGSIAYVDQGGMLQVGPRSAGADPGPACYDLGGVAATVSDANLVLGRLTFDVALAGNLQLNLGKARASIKCLAEKIDLSIEETAKGIIEIANEHMARAIRLISVNRGYDPKDFTLASFGGAGGLHVCALATAMGMRNAIVPVHGGVLSALGMVTAKQGRQFSKTVNLGADSIEEDDLEQQFQIVEQQGIQELIDEGLDADHLDVRRSAELRYCGQSYTLNIEWQGLSSALETFQQLHQQRYGYTHNTAIELLTIRVNVSTANKSFRLPELSVEHSCNNIRHIKVYGESEQAILLSRSTMAQGECVRGPAVITEYSATTYIESDWSAEVDKLGNLILQKQVEQAL